MGTTYGLDDFSDDLPDALMKLSQALEAKKIEKDFDLKVAQADKDILELKKIKDSDYDTFDEEKIIELTKSITKSMEPGIGKEAITRKLKDINLNLSSLTKEFSMPRPISPLGETQINAINETMNADQTMENMDQYFNEKREDCFEKEFMRKFQEEYVNKCNELCNPKSDLDSGSDKNRPYRSKYHWELGRNIYFFTSCLNGVSCIDMVYNFFK